MISNEEISAAHEMAWKLAKILHRDVSNSNILIHEFIRDGKVHRRGILSDWDLCVFATDLSDRTFDQTHW